MQKVHFQHNFSALFVLVAFVKSPVTPSLSSLPATMVKDNKFYLMTSTDGRGGVLQDPASDVRLIIPQGFYGTLKGYIETDPIEYLQYISDNECLIAPIPDFTFFRKDTLVHKPRFKIIMKHSLRNESDLEYIRVQHGDIHKEKGFHCIPRKHPHESEKFDDSIDAYCEADREYITITTSHFSQFICTTCKKTCGDDLQAFVYGSIKDVGNDKIAEVKVFLCSPLYRIMDFKEVNII